MTKLPMLHRTWLTAGMVAGLAGCLLSAPGAWAQNIPGLPQALSSSPSVSAAPAPSARVETEQATAELVAHAPQGVAAGKPLWLGLKLIHKPHWHTYWMNPGDSGLPTTLEFALPTGFAVGQIHWPTPRPLPVGPLVNYGYEGTLLLQVPVTVPADFKGSSLDVRLRADWLICKDVCIPEGGDFALEVPVAAASVAHATEFEAARAAQPRTLQGVQAMARLERGALELEVQGLPQTWRGKQPWVMPELAGVIDNAARPAARWEGDRWLARVALSPQRSESPQQMQLVLALPDEPAGLRVPVAIQGEWPALGSEPPAETAASPSTERSGQPTGGGATPTGVSSLGAAMGLALLGGMLLNLMPCVFPILSLKVLGFAAHASQRRNLLLGGLAYTVGVVASFVLLAALLLALRAGGEQLGWGFQLQSPLFVAALAVLFTVIGLNLAGVFEFATMVPDRLASLQARHPVVDAALTGVLAVAVASPCTAPFMGASLGFAATLPATQALLVFAALGLGMALPYLAASAWPGMARFLPRPGPWMAHFKTFMAFPMLATVVWLVWVLGQQAGIDGAAGLLGFLVALAFAAWAWGSPGLGRATRWTLGGLAGLTLVLAAQWALPGLQQAAPADTSGAGPRGEDGWQAWSAQGVQSALSQGRPVFVDFTAAWCVTCQYNKRTTLSEPEVVARFQERGVLLMRADWTRRDAAISQELARLGRHGVPVYALYAPGAAGPRLLSEILTVSEIREALEAMP